VGRRKLVNARAKGVSVVHDRLEPIVDDNAREGGPVRLLHAGTHLSATDGHVPGDVKADLDRIGRFGTINRWTAASEKQPTHANMVRRGEAGRLRPEQAGLAAMANGVADKESQRLPLPVEKVR
jgi:hypothetical protein